MRASSTHTYDITPTPCHSLTTSLFHNIKVFNDCHRPEDVRKSAEASLRDLDCGYIDCLLIHWYQFHIWVYGASLDVMYYKHLCLHCCWCAACAFASSVRCASVLFELVCIECRKVCIECRKVMSLTNSTCMIIYSSHTLSAAVGLMRLCLGSQMISLEIRSHMTKCLWNPLGEAHNQAPRFLNVSIDNQKNESHL